MPIHPIPAPADRATKSWRKTVVSIDQSQTKGYAVQGEFIDPGASYDLPEGGLLLGVDETTTGKIVTLWTVGTDGLTQVKQYVRKGPWAGKATLAAIAKAAAAHPWPKGVVPQRKTLTPNQRAGDCRDCHQIVQPGEGYQDRANSYWSVRHRSGKCPPQPPRPPMRNRYAAPCKICHGWLDADEGILVQRDERLTAVHEGVCPPPDERKPAPLEPNRYTEPCALCCLPIPAGTGVYARGAVTHAEACPVEADGLKWTVSYGRPGRYNPRPDGGYTPGQVLRATVSEHIYGVPEGAPGYRRTGPGMVSLIVAVVAEAKPVYIRDEDGNQPLDLIGEDGWFFQARVRVATTEEAEAILAVERARENVDALRLRAEVEILRAADGEVPAEAPALLDLPGVRVEHRRPGSLAFAASWGAYIHLRVDRPGGWVWMLRHNGADGDNWSANNCGTFVARRMPFTEQRAELVDALAAEFGTIG